MLSIQAPFINTYYWRQKRKFTSELIKCNGYEARHMMFKSIFILPSIGLESIIGFPSAIIQFGAEMKD